MIAALVFLLSASATTQRTSPAQSKQGTIQGVVLGGQKPVADAAVRLAPEGAGKVVEMKTGAAGEFVFSGIRPGGYWLSAQKAGLKSPTIHAVASAAGNGGKVDLILENPHLTTQTPGARSISSATPMEFVDSPNFTVAGITDWTAVGGHGSDSILRTSEALARDTRALKPEGRSATPQSDTVSAKATEAKAHRLTGELDEKQGRPLAAVHEFEEAVRLDPSEQNYFEWGSELLYHRAVWQALEVFQRAAKAYPKSGRMLTALGTALFAGARYDKAALSLCKASDLDPGDVQPYIFMGKVELASPDPLPCIEAKLARFVREQPQNAQANYLYAMAILKRQQQLANKQDVRQAETLLKKAVMLDAKCGEAYLQLGILSYSRRDSVKAIDFYRKAIGASPQLAESYYRLAVAYDRLGDAAKARQEFQLHDEIEKQQAEAVEDQRREIKQFVIANKPDSPPVQ
ncbi:MAG: tetratricopeptide repeat protein [Acidobacteriaceae bacterium]